jgi:hypothetical protein
MIVQPVEIKGGADPSGADDDMCPPRDEVEPFQDERIHVLLPWKPGA